MSLLEEIKKIKIDFSKTTETKLDFSICDIRENVEFVASNENMEKVFEILSTK